MTQKYSFKVSADFHLQRNKYDKSNYNLTLPCMLLWKCMYESAKLNIERGGGGGLRFQVIISMDLP